MGVRKLGSPADLSPVLVRPPPPPLTDRPASPPSAPPSHGGSAEAVPSTRLSPLSPSVSHFAALGVGGSVSQSRGLTNWAQSGEGSALGHTACQWARGGGVGEGREEPHSSLGRAEWVGGPIGSSPSSSHSGAHLLCPCFTPPQASSLEKHLPPTPQQGVSQILPPSLPHPRAARPPARLPPQA